MTVSVPRIFAMLSLFACLTLPNSALAGTYWVSPTGAAAWTACQSDLALSGTAACSLGTANRNAAAGDTVYLRGGTYSIDVNGGSGIAPAYSGTSSAKITFAAYTGEVPSLRQANTTNRSYGILLNGRNWIRVIGVAFTNFQLINAWMYNGASYDEIAYCSFTREPGFEAGDRVIVVGGYGAPWSTNNWIHHNYASTRQSVTGPCNEGVDLVRLGNAESSPAYAADNYNTFEWNYLEYGAHSVLATYSKYNVVRNNIAHNEPWITGCASYTGAMPDLSGNIRGSSSTTIVTIGTGSQTFTIATGLSTTYWKASLPVSIVYARDYAQAMYGLITSYDPTTGVLAVKVTRVAPGASGTYAAWIASERNVPYYTNAAFNGRYGHRVFLIGDGDIAHPNYNLVEGNRLGFGGANPNNGGPSNLDIEAPNNIARYNFLYAGMASGIFFKSADGEPYNTGGVNNWVYNNTTYYNGTGFNAAIYGGLNVSYNGQGICQYSIHGGATLNRIKNNLAYANGSGDICFSNWGNPSCTPSGIDIVENNLTGTDPTFVNPDLSDPASQNLFPSVPGYTTTPVPDLSLQAGSPAIDEAGYLTQANGSGSRSTTLVVDDAGYFQDGTWGSSLSRVQADRIAIGTVDKTVEIRSIDYATNTITLVKPMTWSDNAPIWLYKKSDGAVVLAGAGPDFGASESGVSQSAKDVIGR